MRCRLRLGLAVGVRSLTLPACSKCSNARDNAAGSTGSEFRSRVPEANSSWLRLWVAVGGVLDSGGEMSVGVKTSSTAPFSVVGTALPVSSAMAKSYGVVREICAIAVSSELLSRDRAGRG
jgi:hypothetical protein